MTTKSMFRRSTPSDLTLCSKILALFPVSKRMRLPPIPDKGCEAPIHGQQGRLAERGGQDGNPVWRFCSSHTCEQQNDTRQRASRDLPIQRRPDSHSHCLTSLILLADRCDAFGSFSIRNTYIIDGFHSYFLSH